MKKQTLANIAVAAAFLFTLNLAAQPRGPQRDPLEGRGGKGAPAAPPAQKPNNGPATRPMQQPTRPLQQPTKPLPAPKPDKVVAPGPKPTPAIHPTPVPGPTRGPVVHPTPAPGPKPGPVVHPAPAPGPVRPVPTPAPAPGPVVRPVPAPGPVVHPGPKPGPAPHHDPHFDHHGGHNHGGFFDRLFAPAPPRPRGYRTFPHRHPTSKFTFIWFDYLPSGKVYELTDYVIYECRFCHLVHYSPVIPENALCPAAPGQIHSYQILGYYGDLAFRCATCGVTINSNAIPNVGWCGTQYHVWQQLIEY